jgi:biotin transport system substrate-specific component
MSAMSTFSSSAALPRRRPVVLSDVIPRSRAVDALLVLGGAGLTSLLAQVTIHVPSSPVPVTGQTLGVVVAGAALGARRGMLSQLLYLLLGLVLPVYAGGTHGWDVVWGASGGYIVGFVIAAYLVGLAAERGADRRVGLAFATFAAGQIAIFGIGVPWLKVSANLDWSTAIHEGFTIFIVGGIVKALIAAGAAPAAWRAVARLDRRDDRG